MKKLACLFLFLACAAAWAEERYALLIGISHYTPGQRLRDLDGPKNDVNSMEQALKQLGYKSANVTVLRDAQASKAGILEALDAMIARVNAGDYFFFYYSGHGTSPQDQAVKDLPIDIDSGALFPADFRMGTPQEIVDRLVWGRRDLRPRLARLDGKATVFGLLDTCFSANLMKSVRARGTPKSVPLWQLTQTSRSMDDSIAHDIDAYEQAAKTSSPFPYTTIAWISAAMAGQSAVDLDRNVLAADPTATIDGQPHGALTNAFLKGLTGAADRNHDGVVTHSEMYDFLMQESRDWPHQPAWMANESNKTFPGMPLLDSLKALNGKISTARFSGVVHVQLAGDAAVLRPRLAGLRGVEVTDRQPDLILRAENGGYLVSQAGGIPLIERPVDASAAVARIAAEPDVRKLIDWSYPQQRVNVELSLWKGDQPFRLGFLRPTEGAGDVYLKMTADRQVWPLVVDVDVTGHIAVLYPHEAQKTPIPAAENTVLGAENVLCPCGIEFIKAFVFDRKPDGFESWVDKNFEPADPLLRKLLAAADAGIGETTLRIVTNDRN